MKRSLFALILCFLPIIGMTPKYDPVIVKGVSAHETVVTQESCAWHKARIMQESAFKEDALSPVGAMGLCQFIKPTADWLGVDPWNPSSSIEGMIKYTRVIDKYYDDASPAYKYASAMDKEMLIDAGYNWRMDRLSRMARTRGWQWSQLEFMMPLETRKYSPSIQGYKNTYMKRGEFSQYRS